MVIKYRRNQSGHVAKIQLVNRKNQNGLRDMTFAEQRGEKFTIEKEIS